MLQDKNWLRDLAANPSSAETIFENIRLYLDDQTESLEYYHWMRSYLSTAVLFHWLEQYIRSLLYMNEAPADMFPLQFLNPRSNPHYGFDDPDAPPLALVLGIGSCFLLRELARTGTLHNPQFHPYCYVPSAKVRRVLDACGIRINGESGWRSRLDQSKEIYDQLCEALGTEKATFDNAFSIPLEIISGRAEVWKELLGTGYVSEDDLDNLPDSLSEESF